jgi:hypothetical protein
MRTNKQLIDRYTFLINEEVKKGNKYGEITRFKRIIEISKGINPIEKKSK